jgi:hypothetical protein
MSLFVMSDMCEPMYGMPPSAIFAAFSRRALALFQV